MRITTLRLLPPTHLPTTLPEIRGSYDAMSPEPLFSTHFYFHVKCGEESGVTMREYPGSGSSHYHGIGLIRQGPDRDWL